MFLNIAIVAVIGLIAYWWASQGFFSAILHLVTVIAAAAIAFAVWEPLAIWAFGKLDKPTLTDMAWGISLLIVFGAAIQILRPITIRGCPANVRLNDTVSLVGGGVVGAVAGVIAAGVLLIGVQFIQGPTPILQATTWTLDPSGTPETVDDFWVDADKWTAQYFSTASLGPLWMPNPLAKWHPKLNQRAGLYRQSFEEGKSRMGINSDAFSVEWVKRVDPAATPQIIENLGSLIDRSRQTRGGQGDIYQVRALFNTSTWDAGNKLHIIRPQASLIVRTPDGDYQTVYPHAFVEPIRQDTNVEGRWLWEDSLQTAATSVGSPEKAPITFEFLVPAGSTISHFVVRAGRKESDDLPISQDVLTMSDIQQQIQAANSVESAPPGSAITSAKPWQGYLMTAVLAAFVVFSNMMPAKRGHQD